MLHELVGVAVLDSGVGVSVVMVVRMLVRRAVGMVVLVVCASWRDAGARRRGDEARGRI